MVGTLFGCDAHSLERRLSHISVTSPSDLRTAEYGTLDYFLDEVEVAGLWPYGESYLRMFSANAYAVSRHVGPVGLCLRATTAYGLFVRVVVICAFSVFLFCS